MSVVDELPFAEEKKKYILQVLDPVLEEMVCDVLTEVPKNPLDFMIRWLRRRSHAAAGVSSVKAKNVELKKVIGHIRLSISEAGGLVSSEGAKDQGEESEDEDDDCDELPESARKPESQIGQARQSVSAEAYGQWNQKKSYNPPSYPKDPVQKARLRNTLLKNFIFSHLEDQDLETVLMAMMEQILEPGTKVIAEGEDGDCLFVVEAGSLECIKTADGAEKTVKTCAPGDVFGELALLYNCPRAATVVAKDSCVCWQLDRECFNHIVKDAAVKRRNKYDSFLKDVALLSSIDPYERSQVADALKSETFKKGDLIVRQDEPGDKFYIVEDGQLYATKQETRVMDYKTGDYFGELALLKNQPRAASVAVESDSAKVLSMSRASFNKMLGPLQSILNRQATSYT